jgi:opacity protein-like surface antigen
MKMDVRTSVALYLLVAATTAAAQNTNEQTVPAPQQSAPPPPAQSEQPAQPAQPATPALPRLPSQQYQYSPPPQSPPPPQYKYQYAPPPQQSAPPPPPPAGKPDWVHSETRYPAAATSFFEYHPLRFHIDGGGTITQRANDQLLDNGWNAGLGLSWFPTRHLPLGIRVDGTYMEFDARPDLLNQAASATGTRVDNGTRRMWGGDVDLELDLPLSPYVRAYLLAGGGWYRMQDTFRQTNYYPGYLCDWWGCGPGYYGVDSIVSRNTSDWHFAKNAGFGFEFAMAPRVSFFVEARYMRLNPNNAHSDFLPIRAGFRF